MSTTVDRLYEEIQQLPPDEQQQLKERLNQETPDAERARRMALSRSIRGKYRVVLTSSEEFIARKAVEIAKEDRECENAIADYARRWEIETLFGCLKTRGFCLEQTHVTDTERLKKLLASLALSFCWAHVVGEWLSAQQPLTIRKHGRPARSLFRHGLDHLRRILCNQLCKADRLELGRVINLLSCT